MKKSKIMSSLMVASLVLTLCSSVFAVDKFTESPGQITYDITSTVNVPTLKVTIQEPAGTVVNPYGMTVDIPWDASHTTDQTVFSVPRLITNESDIGMVITATPTAQVPTYAALSNMEIPEGSTDTAIFLKLSMAQASDSTITDYKGADDASGTTSFSGTEFAVFTDKNSNQKQTCSVTLNAIDKTTTPGTDIPSYGAYLIHGNSSGSKWVKDDKINMNLIFDIQPKVS